MKAKEIRELRATRHEDGHHLRPTEDCVYFLQEIAAQFADLNERLDGFMASMIQLSKAITELNEEIRKPKVTRTRTPWKSDKVI